MVARQDEWKSRAAMQWLQETPGGSIGKRNRGDGWGRDRLMQEEKGKFERRSNYSFF